jgi:putative phosphoribosyl transferase
MVGCASSEARNTPPSVDCSALAKVRTRGIAIRRARVDSTTATEEIEMRFQDRRDAGRRLGELLRAHERGIDTIVLALPRGGVPVAYEVARALQLPLDVMIVRKLGAPGQPELALGAIASGGAIVFNHELLPFFSADALQRVVAAELAELTRREHLYRGTRLPLNVSGKTIILIDDGIATGASMRAAVQALRAAGAREIIAAVPVASDVGVQMLEHEAGSIVYVVKPPDLSSVGEWYADFSQTTDAEVIELLKAMRPPG